MSNDPQYFTSKAMDVLLRPIVFPNAHATYISLDRFFHDFQVSPPVHCPRSPLFVDRTLSPSC